MRLWSIDFKYLDSKGLVALWRETLLAKNVLEGNTKGYKNHPQLIRFKQADNSLVAINTYLYYIYSEAKNRGYNFNESKFDSQCIDLSLKLNVTDGQLDYEFKHLLNKLKTRDYDKFLKYGNETIIAANLLFEISKGSVANWERV